MQTLLIALIMTMKQVRLTRIRSATYFIWQTINEDGSISTYIVANLSPGSYEFAVTSFNSAGVESRFSNTATKQVQQQPKAAAIVGAGQQRVLYTPTVEISCIIASGQGNQ